MQFYWKIYSHYAIYYCTFRYTLYMRQSRLSRKHAPLNPSRSYISATISNVAENMCVKRAVRALITAAGDITEFHWSNILRTNLRCAGIDRNKSILLRLVSLRLAIRITLSIYFSMQIFIFKKIRSYITRKWRTLFYLPLLMLRYISFKFCILVPK